MVKDLLLYLPQQIILRIKLFIWHWYVEAFLIFWQKLLDVLEKLDRTFAVKITIRHWFKPLYQDRTIIGYTLGFIFRTFRILLAVFFYTLIFLISCLLYLFWALLPLFLIYKFFL